MTDPDDREDDSDAAPGVPPDDAGPNDDGDPGGTPGEDGGPEPEGEDTGVPSWLPDPAVEYHLDGEKPVVVGVTPAFERAFDADDPAGRPLAAVLDETFDDADGAAAAARRRSSFERVVERPRDGAYLLRVVPPGEDTGRVLVTDVTDLAAERDRLSQVASVLAHDVRNQVGTARLRLKAARDDPRDTHFEKALDALDRMESILDDALRIGREGWTVEEPEPVDLAGAARDAWATVEGTDATLAIEDPPRVAGDEGLLRELFENLFHNVVQHAGSDASVAVVARPGGFAVVDDGPGISPDERDRVFEAGYSGADGTGLGLAIVDRIAEAHGWSVSVTDSPDGGCEVRVTGVESP